MIGAPVLLPFGRGQSSQRQLALALVQFAVCQRGKMFAHPSLYIHRAFCPVKTLQP
jgi:hypothetical protein